MSSHFPIIGKILRSEPYNFGLNLLLDHDDAQEILGPPVRAEGVEAWRKYRGDGVENRYRVSF